MSAEHLCSSALTWEIYKHLQKQHPKPCCSPPNTYPAALKLCLGEISAFCRVSFTQCWSKAAQRTAGRAGSVPGSHKQGVLSSTSRPGCSRSAWPRCRCSPGCCTLHTQTQGGPDLPLALPKPAGKYQVPAPDINPALMWDCGIPSCQHKLQPQKALSLRSPTRLQRDQSEAQQARVCFRKWHLPDNKPLFLGEKKLIPRHTKEDDTIQRCLLEDREDVRV